MTRVLGRISFSVAAVLSLGFGLFIVPSPFAASAKVRRPLPAPSPDVTPAAPVANCPDLADFIRSGGAIPVQVQDVGYSITMTSSEFRHEQPAVADFPRIPSHTDYGQKWVFHAVGSPAPLLQRVYLPDHLSHAVEMRCLDGQLALRGILENCDWYPKGMDIGTIGRAGSSCVPGRNWTIREASGQYRDYEYIIDGGEFGGRLVPIN